MSFPSYPQYRTVDLGWLRQIPATWKSGAFKRLIDIQNGADHKKVQQDEGYPVYGSGGPFTCSSEFLYDGEAVLLGRKGTIDQPLHVDGPFWTVDTMYWAKIRDGVCGRFAYYVATVIPFAYYKTNTAVPSMTQRALSDHVVPLPPFAEQRAIATFLDHQTAQIDAAIAAQRSLIALLVEQQSSKTVRSVTQGLNGDTLRKVDIGWIRSIAEAWSVIPIRKVARLESGHTPSRSKPEYWTVGECTIPWFTLADINQVRSGQRIWVEATANNISPLGLANSSARLLPVQTVFLSRTASVGFSGIMATEMAVSQDFAAWVCGDRLLPEYLLLCLRAMKPEFERLMMGSTHKTIYMPDIEKLTIPLPPIEEQREIVDQLLGLKTKSERLVDRAQANIALLRERRAALITAAVTGKIDVRDHHHTDDREAA